ncbi:FecR domain-containing protein [Chitinophaga pendula]|uniref:FecR family protein n=1 Tax=Chitinophaga TaxID=79328 RepID=UPI000BAF63A1|nr:MULTISPECIES: FecR domain-containing protein [Chitinophaga]ASZ12466.1 hypothetical protein CK934_16630 [Chitinophaga sp. MD30]UCJ09935.1 FecR domain-containing protein [Chitinophaga pendula]
MDFTKHQLLEKFLLKTCTEAELQTVKALLDTAEGRAILYKKLADIDSQAEDGSGEADQMRSQVRVQHLKQRIHKRIAVTGRTEQNKIVRRNLLKIAAVLTGIVLTGTALFYQFKKTTPVQGSLFSVKQRNKIGPPLRCILPDSSVVYLAACSELRYSPNFPSNGRELELTGEAFFEVAQNQEHPFIVHTGAINTRVLGTSFKIQAFADEPFEIVVATGKVRVNTPTEKVILTPGSAVDYDVAKNELKQKITATDKLLQWKSGEVVFDDQPLKSVVNALQRRFGVKIIMPDAEMASYKVSGSFATTDNANDILYTLSVMGKFRYQQQADTIFHLYRTR